MHRPAFRALLLTGFALGLAGQPSLSLAQETTAGASHDLRPTRAANPRPASWASRTVMPAYSQAPGVQSVSSRPQIIPRGGYQINPIGPVDTPAPAQAQPQRLTPASAFYAGPAPRPIPFSHRPEPAPAPSRQPPPAYRIAPAQPAQTRAVVVAPEPMPMPAQASVSAPVATPMPASPSTAIQADTGHETVPHDPMAPRRDAPIFRIAAQDAAPPIASASAAPTPASAPAPAPYAQSRYYSVHRQYGRQPDPAPQTSPVYLDALPVDVSNMAGTADLAEPPAPPNLIRNANGRIQAMPDLNDID